MSKYFQELPTPLLHAKYDNNYGSTDVETDVISGREYDKVVGLVKITSGSLKISIRGGDSNSGLATDYIEKEVFNQSAAGTYEVDFDILTPWAKVIIQPTSFTGSVVIMAKFN